VVNDGKGRKAMVVGIGGTWVSTAVCEAMAEWDTGTAIDTAADKRMTTGVETAIAKCAIVEITVVVEVLSPRLMG
jgi:hypothetical protein